MPSHDIRMLTLTAPKRLYLMRHGHTFDNNPENHVPEIEAQLTDKGRQQAQQTAEFLHKHVAFDAIYSSALQRTKDTAMPLAVLQNLTVQPLALLNEIPLRTAKKPTFNDVIIAYNQLAADLKTKDYEEIELDGISFAALFQGYLEALRQILMSRGSFIAVYAHGGTNMILLCHLMGLPLDRLMSLSQYNCCINIIDCYPPAHFMIQQINYTCWDPAKGKARLGTIMNSRNLEAV